MISKEQERSKFALKEIDKLGNVQKEMANFIVGTPTMILQNGFGQTMAFLLSKSKDKNDKYGFVFNTIAQWAEKEFPEIEINEAKKSLVTAVSSMDQTVYITLQEESLKILQWLKRYARAFQEEENKGEK